ncbi:MAG: HNH endonuclease [Candidatus Marinimicrobia bacterium]|nr:HNH endonuclease [Candidatus Neomarinimicrobiota bacterium]
MKNIEITIKQIIDLLFPKLDAYEQMFYLYLFRNTILEDKIEFLIPISSIHKLVGFGIGRLGSPVSRQVVRNKFKSLEEKGCIKLVKRTRKGIIYQFYLPEEINGVINDTATTSNEINIDRMDFYKVQKNKIYILERENCKCFYCGKKITNQDFAVDHVTPQMLNGNNSYKNCVATCIDCNSLKQGKDAENFTRDLYRKQFLNKDEFSVLLQKLKDLSDGKLKPQMSDDKNFI